MRFQPSDFLVLKKNLTLAGSVNSGDDIKNGSFSGTIWSNQAGYMFRFDLDIERFTAVRPPK